MEYIDESFYNKHKKIIMLRQHKNGGIKTQIFDFTKEKEKEDFKSYNIKDHILFKFDLYDNADFYIEDNQHKDLIKVNIIKSIF